MATLRYWDISAAQWLAIPAGGTGPPGPPGPQGYTTGQTLGSRWYAPASSTNYTTSSTAYAALDTTNMTVSFTAISTGAFIDLEAMALCFANTAASAQGYYWGLFIHNTTSWAPGSSITQAIVAPASTGTQTWGFRVRARINITGLTPGNAYQYDWCHASGSTSATFLVNAANTAPASMFVFAN